MTSYDVKVRGTVYLWGSSGITVNLAWPLLLVVQNDVTGDEVTIVTETTTTGSQKTYGTLQPGECYTLSLLNLRGVFAVSDKDTDSKVTCTLLVPHVGPPIS
jgi:hypothetical protein